MNFFETYNKLDNLWNNQYKIKLTEGMLKLLTDLGIADTDTTLTEGKADTQRLIDFAGEDLANRFLAVRNKFKSPENDLYYWIKNHTPVELEAAIIDAETGVSKSRAKKAISDNGAELVGENEYWKVYHITTFEASQKYGRDTKWCITGINNYGDKYWKDYTNRGIKFYFYITKGNYDARGTSSKMALAVALDNTYNIYDQQDNKVNGIANAPVIEGLPNIAYTKYKKYVYSGGQIPKSLVADQFIIDSNIDKIDANAFEDCSSLVSIVIPNNITSIGDDAFNGCSNLASVIIPNSVTSIGNNAFCGCTSLTSIVIPDSVTSIGSGAFSHCFSLITIEIPDSVTELGSSTFDKCTSLTSAVLSSNLTCIPDFAFSCCSSLTSIAIPNNVTSVGDYTFNKCNSLKNVTIGNNVTSIGTEAFSWCYNLTSVIIPSSVVTLGTKVFSLCSRNLTIYCVAKDQPTSWPNNWNTDGYTVVWGYNNKK